MEKVFTSLDNPKLVESLKQGEVGILPTDTVYGLVACAADKQAVAKLYELKKRDNKPGTIIAANVDQLVGLGLTRRYLKAVEQFWPNPISVVVPGEPELAYLHLGKMSLAVRVPKLPKLHQLLEKTGPLLTSSANHPGQPEARNIAEAKKYFEGTVDFYVNGGDLAGQKPSTVIRIVDDAIEVLRQGAVDIDESGRMAP